MSDHWVINASPIILLAKAGVIHHVPAVCDTLVIPSGVVAEVQRGQLADMGRIWLTTEGAGFVRPVPRINPALSEWRGGAGEAEVVTWAIANPGFKAVLDDDRARTMARRHGVSVLGSLRVIVLLKERGFIQSVRPVLNQLRGAGAFISDRLIDRTIALAGEE